MTHFKPVLFVLAALLTICSNAIPAAASSELVDSGTSRNGMHSCPVGTFVVGIHVGNNLLLCSSAFGSYTASSEIIDQYGYDFGRSCPDGMAMTGFHQANNLLACAPFTYSSLDHITDPQSGVVTQRSGMHACPAGYPMSGIWVPSNQLQCGNRGRTVDTDTQRQGMHACPVSTYIIGVYASSDRLMCAARFGSYAPWQERIDTGTQMQGMHACPVGTAMTGLHIGNNWLLCTPAVAQSTYRFVDASTVDKGGWAHSCPEATPWSNGFPLSGINVDRNLFLCDSGPLLPGLS